MAKSLKVGIIGASAERGWAKESHVPAVKALTGLELAAVATNSMESAAAAAAAFGVKGYGSATELINDASLDIVTIAVKVPDHRNLVLGALAAGKHIYCEWPLGRDLAEADELRDAAGASGLHAIVGLQARESPALRQAHQLIASGALGRVLTARMSSGTVAFPRRIGRSDLYLEDAANGATLLTIHGGHALDAMIAVLGPLEDIAALTAVQYPEVEVAGERLKLIRSVPDYFVAQSRVSTGAVASLEVAGGRSHGAKFWFEITGEKGVLVVEAAASRGFQSGRLTLSLNGEPRSVDEGELESLPDAAVNVGGMYAALRDQIGGKARTAPDFEHAVRLTKLNYDLLASSLDGAPKRGRDWPRA